MLTKVADKVLNRILPKVDAAAGSCGCRLHHSTCESGRYVDHYYRQVTNSAGVCAVWTAFCYKRRTQEPC